MRTNLTKKWFDGMNGAYAALFAPGLKFFDLNNVKSLKYTGRDYFVAQCLRRRLDKETIWFAGCDEQLLCGLDCGAFRKPFELLTAAQYKAYAKRFAALKIVKAEQAR